MIDEGCNDDLVACLFLFDKRNWPTYFKELTDMDIREDDKENQNALEQDMAIWFCSHWTRRWKYREVVDEYGTRWDPIIRDYSSIGKVKLGIILSKEKNKRYY